MNFVCFNGEMLAAQVLFSAQNRGFRYGDGVFETIKVFDGKNFIGRISF
jgi:branched-chain amino acid aminotransferase